jgi:hypothetical protein
MWDIIVVGRIRLFSLVALTVGGHGDGAPRSLGKRAGSPCAAERVTFGDSFSLLDLEGELVPVSCREGRLHWTHSLGESTVQKYPTVLATKHGLYEMLSLARTREVGAFDIDELDRGRLRRHLRI